MIKINTRASKALILIILFTGITLISPVKGMTTVSDVKTIDEQFKVKVTIKAETRWPDGKDQPINISITSVEMPTNTSSRIVISFINVQVMQGTTIIDYKAQTKKYSLNTINDTISTVITLSPPVVDSFHLNITIIGNTEIAGTQSPQYKIDVRFPKEGSIIVLREELKPLVQLYGFPDANSFWLWFRIFLVPLTIIVLEIGFVGGYVGFKKIRRGKK